MKTEVKRIFISDLPETATKDEIKIKFEKYGTVKAVEIKERKELGPKNSSLFFSYINIEIDDNNLQKCFKDFRQNKWYGNFVELQIARESFLDRLKREREVQNKIPETSDKKLDVNLENGIVKDSNKNPALKINKNIRKITENEENKKDVPNNIETITNNVHNSCEMEDLDMKIVNNKGKSLEKALKIESFGKPILEINNVKKSKVKPKSESDLKRIESLNRMKKGYNSQKMILQSALAKIDIKNKKGNENFSNGESMNKKRLFDESDDEEIDDVFRIKEQFQGKKGQELLQLQSRYKNDERFKLDSRFLDDQTDKKVEESQDIDIDEEKKKQFEILEEVLGRKVISSGPEQKSMLRFDPSQPEHSKYELKNTEKLTKNKKKPRKISESNEIVEPLVSKEVFYKVSDGLKETLHENKGFSLLDKFGKATTQEENELDERINDKPISGRTNGPNPFKYDSSDDEMEELNKTTDSSNNVEKTNEKSSTKLWQEPFFFKTDDYRLQEGFDFVQRINATETTEFNKLRRDVKTIVRAKVRNNLRKNKPFKKKLGGNRRKKMIRMKKALNR